MHRELLGRCSRRAPGGHRRGRCDPPRALRSREASVSSSRRDRRYRRLWAPRLAERRGPSDRRPRFRARGNVAELGRGSIGSGGGHPRRGHRPGWVRLERSRPGAAKGRRPRRGASPRASGGGHRAAVYPRGAFLRWLRRSSLRRHLSRRGRGRRSRGRTSPSRMDDAEPGSCEAHRARRASCAPRRACLALRPDSRSISTRRARPRPRSVGARRAESHREPSG